MSLKQYHKKRNFKKTTEPFGKIKSSAINNLFVVQKHAASHLHYDFRLQIGTVLKSWAIPKGPSLDPSVKRLAVHVEDHPIEYGTFEGIIPKGQYGGGTVQLWDQGTWECKDNAFKSYQMGMLTFILKGKKLKGLWKLIQIKKDPKNWLLMKLPDQYSDSESNHDILKEQPLSVLSGYTLADIAENYHDIWTKQGKQRRKNTLEKQISQKIQKKLQLENLADAQKSSIPKLFQPELATLVTSPPIGKNWLHEIKLDGYRIFCYVKDTTISLLSRNHHDLTDKFSIITKALSELKFKSAILDGELVALNQKHLPDFQTLQNYLYENKQATLLYYIFDVIYFDSYNLSRVPLIDRKNILKSIIPINNEFIKYNDHVIGDGKLVYRNACQMGLEGIVSKEINSHYVQKRTSDWLKVKCSQRQEFIIGGYTKPSGSRKYFGALLLGVYSKQNRFIYCGRVGTGFNHLSLHAVYDLLIKNQSNKNPFFEKPADAKDVYWVKPKIIVEVEFIHWTKDGILRHPSFKGLRLDKKPKHIVQEKPKIISMNKSMIKENLLNNSTITNPNRILYPDPPINKLQLAKFYEKVSNYILPYIINRPLTLVRCPHGIENKCFYQKHMESNLLPGIYNIEISEKNKNENYIYIKDQQGLMSLVQMDVLEIHIWNCHVNELEKPDMIVFDLDPAEDVNWNRVIETAKDIRKQLQLIHLTSFIKTSGGKGLHIVIPIKPKINWSEIADFAHAFTDYLVSQNPNEYIGTMSKFKRKGKIFIDYIRNTRGSTTVAPYSTRARPNAVVSTPLDWKELKSNITADRYTINNLFRRLSNLKSDPWQDYFKIEQELPKMLFNSKK